MNATPLQPAQFHSAQNSLHARGHVVVLTGRGESAELYRRLGSRIAYDGYAVSVVELPPLDAIDAGWLASVELWDGAGDAGALTLVGSDSGAAVAVLLAERLGAAAVVLAGVGGIDFAQVRLAEGADPIAPRSACSVYRSKLEAGDADLDAPAAQRFDAVVAATLQSTAVEVPALVIHGGADAIAPLGDALQLYRRIAPDALTVTVAGGLHDILNDVSHRTVSAEIVQFLERRGGASIVERFEPTATASLEAAA